MATLIRVEGNAGSQIYSGTITADKAKDFYLDEFGYEADRVDIFSFDQCSHLELRNFARTGEPSA